VWIKLFLLVFVLMISFSAPVSAETRMCCITTTDIRATGILDYILPIFQKKTGIKVELLAVGPKALMGLAKQGYADVVFSGARKVEIQAVQQGDFVNRQDVMYDDFLIIAPPDDPAKIKDMKSATEAFRKIAENSHQFISRGDASYAHLKELSIWKKTGIDPKGKKWYLETQQDMPITQWIAYKNKAYVLVDRHTWVEGKEKHKIEMIPALEGDPLLFHQYGVMALNPEKFKKAKYKEAMEFINWLISKEGQQAIASYRDTHGNQLFFPNAVQL
jgi:tungstate transport system substrate-binding protein